MVFDSHIQSTDLTSDTLTCAWQTPVLDPAHSRLGAAVTIHNAVCRKGMGPDESPRCWQQAGGQRSEPNKGGMLQALLNICDLSPCLCVSWVCVGITEEYSASSARRE